MTLNSACTYLQNCRATLPLKGSVSNYYALPIVTNFLCRVTNSAYLVVGPSLSLDQRLGIRCQLTSVIRHVIVKNSQKTVKTAKMTIGVPIVTCLPRLYQPCTNSVPIVKNSQKTVKTAKMTIGVPIVTCLHRVRQMHKAVRDDALCKSTVYLYLLYFY